jgi:hypothetical protein
MADEKKPLTFPPKKEAAAPAAAAVPEAEAPKEMVAQFRSKFMLRIPGQTVAFEQGVLVSSNDYDLKMMMRQGAQLDLLDFASGQILGNLNELLAAGALA